ncbi:MAG: endonuclease MutS2 [Ruminococcaceae bacterium]|nr:endonuclease MutS2 [Oscillospiraceae bacterium]
MNFDRAISILEFDKIRQMLSEVALCESAADMAMRLSPDDDIHHIRRRLRETSDAKTLAGSKGAPSFWGVKDITGSLDRAEKSAVLTTRELLDIAAVEACVEALISYHGENESITGSVDVYFERLIPLRSLRQKIVFAILGEETIADEASPTLAAIRRRMRIASNRIKETLQKYITGNTYSKYLQENIITSRNGRYVIPVKAECRNDIKGLVHDTSSSGATLFIEPAAVVESNNELRILEKEEEKEIERILAELSAMAADNASSLRLDYYNITELAFIFARAELSFRMNAAEPVISEKGGIELFKARHPLLDRKTAVPIDIRLGDDFTTLVITGPNTGGKTVSLKTLGLLTLMAQAGLHIPCADHSKIRIFHSVLADIGDEQSIEQSLSTFSAHMKNIVGILEDANEHSLVLFDELGSGTDPVEGAALAMAILETVKDRGCCCAATTHYAELKAYALDTDGVCNASCEFDIETLRPTYRLIIGTPGRSNAFAISRKLGLDPAIIDRANALVASDNRRFETVVEKLENARVEAERYREQMAKERAEYEQFKREAEATLKKRLANVDKDVEKAKEEANRIIMGAKITSNYVFGQLEELKKKKDSEDFAKEYDRVRKELRGQLDEASDKIDPVIEDKNEDYVLPRALRRGDSVEIVNIGKQGFLETDPDKNGTVTVRVGIMTTKTNIKNLRLVEEAVTITDSSGKKTGTSSFVPTLTKTFSPELDIRGETGDDGWFILDKYLDDALMLKVASVRIIHGKGTGLLRKHIWNMLKKDRRVASYRMGTYGEGDSGVTIVELKIK